MCAGEIIFRLKFVEPAGCPDKILSKAVTLIKLVGRCCSRDDDIHPAIIKFIDQFDQPAGRVLAFGVKARDAAQQQGVKTS